MNQYYQIVRATTIGGCAFLWNPRVKNLSIKRNTVIYDMYSENAQS